MNFVFCPNCAPTFHRVNTEKRVGVRMECTESNYSGTDADLFHCSKCDKKFFVTYKVDTITEIEE